MKERILANIPAELSKVRPYGDFVLVKRLADRELASPIWIPEESKREMTTGTRRGLVLAIGPGDKLWERWTRYSDGARAKQFWPLEHTGKRCEMDVAVGDEVLYPRTPANEVCLDGEEYCFIHEEEIRAVLEHSEQEMKEFGENRAA